MRRGRCYTKAKYLTTFLPFSSLSKYMVHTWKCMYQISVLLNIESGKYFKADGLILAYLSDIKMLISAIQIKDEKRTDITESDYHLDNVLKCHRLSKYYRS